jgi:transposase
MDRRKFTPEFKREAVELTRQPGIKVSQVARDLGINDNILTRWRRELSSGKPAFTGSGSPRDEEVAALKRELARVKKERDFLKDAAAFFAKGSS